MEKNNYQKYLEEIKKIKKENKKPTLLLHVCCAPCACHPILELMDLFELTVLFNDSNIYPKEEYDKRLKELIIYIDKVNSKRESKIKLIVAPYINEKFNKILIERKDDPEGGKRCTICYSLRYKQMVDIAVEQNFEYVCTAMTVSRHKDEKIINKIIDSFVKDRKNLKYLFSNFKKNKGLEKAIKIAKENNMYHQNYCGCLFSLNIKKETVS